MLKIFKGEKHFFDPQWIMFILILLTFIIRVSIYYSTTLFRFSDYGNYLSVIETINSGKKVFLQNGNCFFALSYIGYFTKYFMGSLDFFFIFNCLAGTLSSLILFYLLKNTFHSTLAGLFAVSFNIIYTEFMTFSSVFYTPVIMILLLTVFVMLLSNYFRFAKILPLIISTTGLVIIFLLTFFFKPELLYFPIFLIVFSFFFVRKDKIFMLRSLTLAFILLIAHFLFNSLHVITSPDKNIISNDFIFFGHTNYGGDGGEGSFVYPENENRYNNALAEWCKVNNVTQLKAVDINRFQHEEIVKFITGSPFRWIKLQFTKFFRTFGIVPESTTFKIIYTGLLKEKLYLTSIVVVAPVAIIILLFIFFFNYSALRKLLISPDNKLHDLQDCKTARLQDCNNKHFFYVYYLLFFYYLIAIVFFGQYQERYRLPVMVLFIIPMLAYFIANFDKRQFLKRKGLVIKGTLIMLFLTVWIFQAKKAINNKMRLINAIELVGGRVDKIKK